jgi:Rv2258c-like winged HTH domain
MAILSGSLLSSMVDIGHRTGLFTAAAQGWATSGQLADRAGLSERYVREWLGAATTGGIVEYDEASEAFLLPPEHAALLTGPTGMGPMAVANARLQLAEQRRDVGFHGADREVQLGGDIGVGQPPAEQAEHLRLARGDSPAGQFARDRRGRAPAPGDRAAGLAQQAPHPVGVRRR